MNGKTKKSDLVYGVPCSCGNLAPVLMKDITINKTAYLCSCGRRYVRDDVTGVILEMEFPAVPLVTTAHVVVLSKDLEIHYSERSAATGKDIPALIVEDLDLCFNQWKRAQTRQEKKDFLDREYERLQ